MKFQSEESGGYDGMVERHTDAVCNVFRLKCADGEEWPGEGWVHVNEEDGEEDERSTAWTLRAMRAMRARRRGMICVSLVRMDVRVY